MPSRDGSGGVRVRYPRRSAPGRCGAGDDQRYGVPDLDPVLDVGARTARAGARLIHTVLSGRA